MVVGDRRAGVQPDIPHRLSRAHGSVELAQRIKANLDRARNMPKISGKRMTNSIRTTRFLRPGGNRRTAWICGDHWVKPQRGFYLSRNRRGNASESSTPSPEKKWAGDRRNPAIAGNVRRCPTSKADGQITMRFCFGRITECSDSKVLPSDFVVLLINRSNSNSDKSTSLRRYTTRLYLFQ